MNSAELAAINVPRRRTGARFAIDDVDDFLARCIDALRSLEQGREPMLGADDVVVKQIKRVEFWGEGYDADAVDDLLDAVVIHMRSYDPPAEDVPEAEAASAAPLTKEAARTLVLFRTLAVVSGLALVGVVILVVMKALGLG